VTMRVVIEIDPTELSKGINQVVDLEESMEIDLDDEMEDEDEGEEFTCPLSTQDEEVNAANRQYAVDEYSYGPAIANWEKKNAKCGLCEYYNVKMAMLDCIADGLDMEEGVGYCEKLAFVCASDNVCNAFEEGGPITDYEEEDYEPLPGGERDIF